MLIPELYEALRKFGRELQHGVESNEDLHGAVPQGSTISWEGLALKSDDVGPVPDAGRFLSREACSLAQARRDDGGALRLEWKQFLADQRAAQEAAAAAAAARAEEERAREAGIAARLAARQAEKEVERAAKRQRRLEKETAAEEAKRAREEAAERVAAERRQQAASRAAAQAAEAERKQRVEDLGARLRRSKVWCTCRKPIHDMRCRIIGSNGQVLWLGADVGVSMEAVQWYHANGGRIGVKGR